MTKLLMQYVLTKHKELENGFTFTILHQDERLRSARDSNFKTHRVSTDKFNLAVMSVGGPAMSIGTSSNKLIVQIYVRGIDKSYDSQIVLQDLRSGIRILLNGIEPITPQTAMFNLIRQALLGYTKEFSGCSKFHESFNQLTGVITISGE